MQCTAVQWQVLRPSIPEASVLCQRSQATQPLRSDDFSRAVRILTATGNNRGSPSSSLRVADIDENDTLVPSANRLGARRRRRSLLGHRHHVLHRQDVVVWHLCQQVFHVRHRWNRRNTRDS